MIDITPFAIGDGDFSFSTEQAMALLHQEVALKTNIMPDGKIHPDDVYLVLGVISLNDEIEVLVKSTDALTQHTKRDFEANFKVVTDDY